MQNKYCIIPQEGNVFWQLVQGMDCAPEQKQQLRDCVIKHVEISLKTNTWEILLQTREVLEAELLEAAAVYIAEKCKINGVKVYQSVVNLE